MIQSIEKEPEFLNDTVAKLVAKFRPHCIYLFGSRARGDHRIDSDYDLYMEVSGDNWPADVRHTEDGFLLGYHPAEIHVRVPGWLATNENDPSRVMYDVARDGILLYGEPGYSRVIPSQPARMVREKPPQRSRVKAQWLRLARLDMDLVLHLAPGIDRWKEAICFHCHQAAEKYLKGLIAAHEKPLKIHDLEALLEDARRQGYILGGITHRCTRLNPLATRGRYPPEPRPAFPRFGAITIDDAHLAMEDARVIAEAVEREIE
jgi:HEPN domain-containing protein/predicted nucleotidyltransferase